MRYGITAAAMIVGLAVSGRAALAEPKVQDLIGEWEGMLVTQGLEDPVGELGGPKPFKSTSKLTLSFEQTKAGVIVTGVDFYPSHDPSQDLVQLIDGDLGLNAGGSVGFWTFKVKGDTLQVTQNVDTRTVGIDAKGTLRRVKPGIAPGRYRLTLSVDIINTKSTGEKWDPAGDPPDPVITATVRGIGKPVILKCNQNDTLIANCLTGNEIDVDLQTTIEVALTDNDAFSNDNIAKVGPFKFAAAANRPGQPLPTPASGRISRVLLQLDPVSADQMCDKAIGVMLEMGRIVEKHKGNCDGMGNGLLKWADRNKAFMDSARAQYKDEAKKKAFDDQCRPKMEHVMLELASTMVGAMTCRDNEKVTKAMASMEF